MTGLIWLGYFITGAALARPVFVSLLGRNARFRGAYWTDEMIAAFWIGVLTIAFWPLTATAAYMMHETPYEKDKRLALENAEQAAKIRELERDLLRD